MRQKLYSLATSVKYIMPFDIYMNPLTAGYFQRTLSEYVASIVGLLVFHLYFTLQFYCFVESDRTCMFSGCLMMFMVVYNTWDPFTWQVKKIIIS